MASGAVLVRRVCPIDAADIVSRDAQDFGVLVLEDEEGAIPVVLPDPGEGLSRAIPERDLVRLRFHVAPLCAAWAALPSCAAQPVLLVKRTARLSCTCSNATRPTIMSPHRGG